MNKIIYNGRSWLSSIQEYLDCKIHEIFNTLFSFKTINGQSIIGNGNIEIEHNTINTLTDVRTTTHISSENRVNASINNNILLLDFYLKEPKNGNNGKDGKTPRIVDGYWYIGDINTNVKAEGIDGINGEPGLNGINGEDGIDAESRDYNISLFKKSEEKPEPPQDLILHPYGWLDVPTNDGIWWQVIGRVNGITNSVLQWSEPIRITAKDGEPGKKGDKGDKGDSSFWGVRKVFIACPSARYSSELRGTDINLNLEGRYDNAGDATTFDSSSTLLYYNINNDTSLTDRINITNLYTGDLIITHHGMYLARIDGSASSYQLITV